MPFKKGQGGRKLGAVNKQRPLREVLDALGTAPDGSDLHAKRLQELVNCDDLHVAVKALALMLAYRHGKPIDRHEISGPEGGPIEYHDHFAIPPKA